MEILEPAKGQSFQFGDTIQVLARLQDAEGNGVISVLDGDQQVQFGSQFISKNGEEVRYELYFNNPSLPNGSYTLKLTAFNGEEKGSDFVKIGLSGLEREFLGLAILDRRGATDAAVSFLAADGNFRETSLLGDFEHLIYNARQERLVALPYDAWKITGLSPDSLLYKYQIPAPQVNGNQTYTFLAQSEKYAFSFNGDGRVLAYDKDGNAVRNFQLPTGFLARAASFQNERLAVGGEQIGTPNHQLFILNPENGAVLKQVPLLGKPVAIDWFSDDELLVSVEKNQNTEVFSYDFRSNLATKLFEIPNENPFALLVINSNKALVSTSKKVYQFNPNFAANPAVSEPFFARDIAYDEVNQVVFFTDNFSVKSGPLGTSPQHLISLSGQPWDIEVVHNK